MRQFPIGGRGSPASGGIGPSPASGTTASLPRVSSLSSGVSFSWSRLNEPTVGHTS